MATHGRETTLLLHTRDLRIRDNPPLAAAASGSSLIPLFVLDRGILGARTASVNRLTFLLESLADLRQSLRARGADLIVRRGDPVEEAMQLAQAHRVERVIVSDDVSRYAEERSRRLAAECTDRGISFQVTAGVTVVEPGRIKPAAGGHYRVFTPYWRAWLSARRRPAARVPSTLQVPDDIEPGALPALDELTVATPADKLPPGGETAGRRRMHQWLRSSLTNYGASRESLPVDLTSHLGAYLHFGCVSSLELAETVAADDAHGEFLRQLCWRDFFHQVTADFRGITRNDYRSRGRIWGRAPDLLEAWKAGQTGYPIVDAAMRSLVSSGWMHNRLRLITAFFFTRYLRLDWRLGAEHFMNHLVDGDVANNYGNWQWAAGTGNDTRPNRSFNVIRQARRFDPDGYYVRRFVPELSGVVSGQVHEPWLLPPATRRSLPYPERIVGA